MKEVRSAQSTLLPAPEIVELTPRGGKEHGVITVVGRNFGTREQDIEIKFPQILFGGSQQDNGDKSDGKTNKRRDPNGQAIANDETSDQTGGNRTNSAQKQQSLSVKINSLSVDPEPNDLQTLSFKIPSGALEDHWLVNRTEIAVAVNSKESRAMALSVVNPHWRQKCALISLGVVLAVLIPVFISFRHLPGVREKWSAIFFVLFLNRKANKYSLSKFQAFGWTVVLLGSYFYLALGTGLTFGFTEIPDFNLSLIGLMAISVGGLVTSLGVEKKNPRNDLEGSPRNLTNLFTEGGDVSLPRLQLFGFTIVAWIVFICYMSSAEVFVNGMPELPANLLGLIGISQGGYIGGKMAGGGVAVNLIVPRRIGVNYQNPIKKLTLNGSGFVDRTKVLFGNKNELTNANCENENVLSIDNVEPRKSPGWCQLIVVPPVGRSILIEKAVEFVDEKIEHVQVPADDKKLIHLRLKGFWLEDTVCTVGGKSTERVKVDDTTKTVTFKRDSEIKSGEDVEVTSEDKYLVATAKS